MRMRFVALRRATPFPPCLFYGSIIIIIKELNNLMIPFELSVSSGYQLHEGIFFSAPWLFYFSDGRKTKDRPFSRAK